MARTTVTPQAVVGPYPALPVSADSLDITWAAADTVNQNQFPITGKEVILARNDNAGAQTITLNSNPSDTFNRDGDITTYSIGAGEYAAFYPAIKGWKQADSQFYLEASAADVFFAILRLP